MASELHRIEVPVRPDRREIVAAQLWALGAVGVWERPGATLAWFAAPIPALAGTADSGLASELADAARSWRREPDRDWQADWKATITPLRAGRTVIVPSWLAQDHQPADDDLVLVLDPGRAFGTGHHATTALCLELLDDLERAGGLVGRDLADIGCGSGILAIAAAARGARVVAADVDPDAVEVTRENAARNAVEVTALRGSVADLERPAEIVVANLLSDVVADLATELVAACRGVLLVSGITTERADDVLATLTDAGAEVEEVRSRDGWIAARLRVTDTGRRADRPERDVAHRQQEQGRTRASGRAGAPAATRTLATGLVLALALLTACTSPAARTTPEDDPAATASQPVLDPASQELVEEVEQARELVARIRSELERASDGGGLPAVRTAVDAADEVLVATADSDRQALLPGESAERTERATTDAAFTVLLTRGRQVGGPIGRDLVESLRDPIAGDLGAWELDAPGVVASARAATAGAGDLESAEERVFALDGEASRAIAWVDLARTSEELELARRAASRATDHLEVIDIALRAVVERSTEPGSVGAEVETGDELGPTPDGGTQDGPDGGAEARPDEGTQG
ncbi:MAG: 50S ribosomal protein L11 methyltransferase [Actinomycetota bacterium]